MSSTPVSTERQPAPGVRTAATVDLKLEVVVIPVSDVDRAKAFFRGERQVHGRPTAHHHDASAQPFDDRLGRIVVCPDARERHRPRERTFLSRPVPVARLGFRFLREQS